MIFMNTVGGYFVGNINNGNALKENMIVGKTYRFTILTERLVRIEYHPKGEFIDLPSERILFRNFPKVDFKIDFSETLMQVTTSYFTINYVKEKPIVKPRIKRKMPKKQFQMQTISGSHTSQPL